MKKLSCHCGEVQGEIQLPKEGLKTKRRCNCTLCKRKGTVMTFCGGQRSTNKKWQ